MSIGEAQVQATREHFLAEVLQQRSLLLSISDNRQVCIYYRTAFEQSILVKQDLGYLDYLADCEAIREITWQNVGTDFPGLASIQ